MPIHSLRFEFDGGSVVRPHANAFRVVRREDFDYALLDEVKKRGIIVREGEPVVSLRRVDGAIRVSTTRGEYDAKVLIGADGANSIARRLLGPSRKRQRFVALEVFTPRLEEETSDSAANSAVFDFRPVARGLRGYYWDFPSLCDGEPRMMGHWRRALARRPVAARPLRH